LALLCAATTILLAAKLLGGTGQLAQASAERTHQLLGVLNGFEPGTPVHYTVKSGQGAALSGQDVIGGDGSFSVPDYDAQSAGKSPITYSLQVMRESDPLLVDFNLNPVNGKVLMSGRGLGAFSDIALGEEAGQSKTKADWAGAFKDIEIPRPPEGRAIQVAFYSSGVLSDVQKDNPLVIRILDAQGGGGPGKSGVNDYKATYCPLSVCDPFAMKLIIQSVVDNYVTALMMMTEQFTAVMMQQALMIGTLLDAKYGLETQQEIQRLTAQAHKDYHTSDQMCRFGTFIRSVQRAEEKTAFDKRALSRVLMNTYLNTEHASSSEGYAADVDARLKQFREVYCDPKDNSTGDVDGLAYICDHEQDQNPAKGLVGGQDLNRLNKDIDFGRTADAPLTIDIDFADPVKSAEEEDIVALARNLYWPRVLGSGKEEQMNGKFPAYMNARHIFAVQNVAHNSFANYIAMKSKSPPEIEKSGWRFMKSLLLQFGLKEGEIDKLIGEYPSYYAQMEILTKKIYQDPDFYTHLYDKPVNIDRIGVSLEALKIMQERDFYEANLRREMLNSLLVQDALAMQVESVNQSINSALSIQGAPRP
jgi:hypothetical protein